MLTCTAKYFLRCNSLKRICKPQVARCFSETILSLRPTLTRILQDSPDLRFLGVSKLRIFSLRFHVCKQNAVGERMFHVFPFAGREQTSSLDVNTNVINNVLLYKYDRPKFFLFLQIFSIVQLIFWTGIGCILYLYLPQRDHNVQPLSKYASENFISVLGCYFAFILGIATTLLMWAFTTRSVKYLILKKGGKMVTYVTYHPFKSKVGTTVPIENINCKTTREEMKNYLPLKVKGRSFYYILDAGGEFTNPKLFDFTVAILRFDK